MTHISTSLQEPLLLPEERWFSPSAADMTEAGRLFADRTGRGVFHAVRAYEPEQCPDLGLPEIAMMGFSNVGKSSLIQGLFHACPRLKVPSNYRMSDKSVAPPPLTRLLEPGEEEEGA